MQTNAVDRDRVHREIRDIGADHGVDALAGQNRVGQLLVAAHIGNRRTAGNDVFAERGVQRERRLQGVVVVKAAPAAPVFAHRKADLQRAAFSCHIRCGIFLSVQKVTDGNVPRDNGAFQRALIVDLVGAGRKRDLIPALGDLIRCIQHFYMGVIAVVDNVAARKNVDRFHIRDLAGGVGHDVDDLFFLRGRRFGKYRSGQSPQEQHGQRCRRDLPDSFHWEITSLDLLALTISRSNRYNSPGRTNSTIASEQSVPLPRK